MYVWTCGVKSQQTIRTAQNSEWKNFATSAKLTLKQMEFFCSVRRIEAFVTAASLPSYRLCSADDLTGQESTLH